ncbi:hypothetical protein M404DRAFT_25958 [Pisolithus tinctorius Marx 270]|uniref:Uncharacterized protein n=1 Tax=Pisolithus tinctorius Marx 270 TaxID=870435 RepID=A0A0C3K5P6_PISTI|nr:hypothetical protein M404DRAFT_25958 [Pisolithus tinctorius Marx 270]
MLEGTLMPQTVQTLSSVLAITFIGTKHLPTDWLSCTFQVWWDIVYEALKWLQENNVNYEDIKICHERMDALLKDGIPGEIEVMIHYQESDDAAVWEREGYTMNEQVEDEGEPLDVINVIRIETELRLCTEMDVPEDVATTPDESKHPRQDDNGDVLPLHVLGVVDVDQTKVSTTELMAQALANLNDETQEGGYVVHHGITPIRDFTTPLNTATTQNPLRAAFPMLFPYGMGTIEADHPMKMRRKDFECDSLALSSITVADLQNAAAEEVWQQPISNAWVWALCHHVTAANGHVLGSDNACAGYHSMIWGMCLLLGGLSLWLTINPVDLHDPIAQVFAGKKIDLNHFNSQLGPDSNRHAENIAMNPYAAAWYFDLTIHTILETLFSIRNHGNRTLSDVGILGCVAVYFRVVEAQGRGTLHMHMLLWLANTPNLNDMQALLQQELFCEVIRNYIQANIWAHLDDLTEEHLITMLRENQLAYSQPHDPCISGWEERTHALEQQLRDGLVCKRRVPWPLSDVDFVDEHGNWGPQRMHGYINAYCPTLLTTLQCNNDLKINTNGADTKDMAFYITAYAMKKQKKSHNLSVLMATALPYHIDNPKYDDMHEWNRLLLYWCINVINWEAELSGPQVMSYLMGYGDTFTSHNYTPLYTGPLFSMVKQMFPELCGHTTERYAYHSTSQEIERTDGDDNNDIITLFCSRRGELYTCTQMQDYLQRGLELEDLSLLSFVCDTWEEQYTPDAKVTAQTSATRG